MTEKTNKTSRHSKINNIMLNKIDLNQNIEQSTDVLHKRTFAEFFAGIGLMDGA